MQEIHSGNRLISSVFRQDPTHHALTAPLYFEGKNFGSFGTTDMNGPFTEAQKALLLEVVHFTELAMNHQIQAFLLRDKENYYVIRLLQGYPADELSTSYYNVTSELRLEGGDGTKQSGLTGAVGTDKTCQSSLVEFGIDAFHHHPRRFSLRIAYRQVDKFHCHLI